jgi:hypothetical protein
MVRFIIAHGSTILSLTPLATSIWLVYFSDWLQRRRSIYGARLEATKEAVRRSRVLWWLQKDDPAWTTTVNEMMEWADLNKALLTPGAYQAFLDVHLWKTLSHMTGPTYVREHYDNAEIGWDRLREELDLVTNGWSLIKTVRRWRRVLDRRRLRKRNRRPRVHPIPV